MFTDNTMKFDQTLSALISTQHSFGGCCQMTCDLSKLSVPNPRPSSLRSGCGLRGALGVSRKNSFAIEMKNNNFQEYYS